MHLLIFAFLSSLLLSFARAYCPAIVKKNLPYDYCVIITGDLPQNKTVYVDDCDPDSVCDFGGRPNKYVWPITQVDLNSNSANYQVGFSGLMQV